MGALAVLHHDAQRMAENVAELEARNRDLEARWNALRSDPSSIAVEGRALGYLANGELAVRLPSMAQPDVAYAGRVLLRSEQGAVRPQEARLWALCCGLFAAAVVFLCSLRFSRKTDTHSFGSS